MKLGRVKIVDSGCRLVELPLSQAQALVHTERSVA